MISQGQVLDKDNLNRAYVSKTSKGTQIMLGSLNVQGTLTGDGSGLISLNGTNITTGTVADARLTTNVFLLNRASTISATNTFAVEQRFHRGAYTDPKTGLAAAIKYAQGLAGDTATFVGDVTIGNGTTPVVLNFGSPTDANGSAPPSGTTKSKGTRIQLWANNYAIGMETGMMWFDSYNGFNFYTNSGGGTSTRRVTIDAAGLAIQQALWVGTTSSFEGSVAMKGGATITGATYLNGNVNLGNAAGNTISIVGTPTFSESVAMNKDLVVAGEFPNSVYNEFPDPLLVGGDTNLWETITRGALTFDAAQKPTGTGAYGSLKFVPTAADAYAVCSYYFDCNPNEWITYSLYMFSTVVSRSSQMFIYWYDAAMNVISTPSNTISSVGVVWTRYSMTLQAPSNARYFKIRIGNNGYNASTNATMYYSAIQIERGRATTGFKPYVGGNPSGSAAYGGVNITGYYLNNDQGVLSLWNDAGQGGRITSKNNYGIRLEVGTGNIVIGGTNTGTYASKVAIGKAETPTATLDVYGNQQTGGTNFRVSYGPNNGGLAGTEFKALTDTTGAGVWAAMYAVKGAASYAGLFNGAVEIDAGNLRVDGGEVLINTTAGQTPIKLNGWNNGIGLWLLSGNSAEAKFFIQSGQSATPNYDYSVEMSYIPGTAGALNGIMKIGQLSRANAAYTHGTTIFYTAGTESVRIDKNSYVGINNASPTQMLDVMGDVVIGANTASNVALEIRGPNIANSTSAQDIKFNFASAGSATIRAYRGGSWDTYMQFLTTPVGSNTPAVRLYLDQNGYIGMSGVTNPAINLAIGDSDTGINWVSDGNMQLYANSQNVIDITSSAIGLKKNVSASGTLAVSGVTTLSDALVMTPVGGLSTIRTGTTAGRISLYPNTSAGNSGSWIELWGWDGTSRQGEMTLAGSYISFYVNSSGTATGTDTMRLTAAGNLGIGNLSPAQKLDVNGIARALNYETTSVNGNGFRFWGSDQYKMYMSGTGDATFGGSAAGAATSDYNLYFRITGGGTNRGFVFQTNSGRVVQIEQSGKINTADGVRVANKFEMTYNSTEDSLDFVYG